MNGLRRWVWAGLATTALAATGYAATTEIYDVPCMVIAGIWGAFRAIGPAVIGLMFMYGAAKYVFSADDPGGRKIGKTIIRHAVIGGIILSLVTVVMSMAQGGLCPGVKI